MKVFWQGTEVSLLKDDELINANTQLAGMHAAYIEQTSNPKFLKRVGNNIPNANPTFIKLREAVIAELGKREIIP